MSNLSMLEQIVSVEDMIRNYRMIFDKVKKLKKPIVVLRRNKPDVAVVDIGWLKRAETIMQTVDEEKALLLIQEGNAEHIKGKTKVLKSIGSLMKSR